MVAGGITPCLVPNEWLKYVLWACLGGLLLFSSLAAGSAQDDQTKSRSMLLWLVIGTDRPTAKIRDHQALALFFLTLAYLGGFTIGTFGAVHV